MRRYIYLPNQNPNLFQSCLYRAAHALYGSLDLRYRACGFLCSKATATHQSKGGLYSTPANQGSSTADQHEAPGFLHQNLPELHGKAKSLYGNPKMSYRKPKMLYNFFENSYGNPKKPYSIPKIQCGNPSNLYESPEMLYRKLEHPYRNPLLQGYFQPNKCLLTPNQAPFLSNTAYKT